MIVVTGATGTVGRGVVEYLSRAGREVTAVARTNPGVAMPRGVTFAAADLQQPSTLKRSLTAADAVLLLAITKDAMSLIDVIAQAKTQRVVLLSSIGAGSRPSRYAIPAGVEAALRDLDVEWTILRPGGFASNSLAWADSIRTQHTVFAPFVDVALPVVDPADIAEVTSSVLMNDGHEGQVYELTGPRPISPREQVAAISEVTGESIKIVEVSREVARSQMIQVMPTEVADATLDVIGAPLPSEQAVSADIEVLLGRSARSYREWVEGAKASFQ